MKAPCGVLFSLARYIWGVSAVIESSGKGRQPPGAVTPPSPAAVNAAAASFAALTAKGALQRGPAIAPESPDPLEQAVDVLEASRAQLRNVSMQVSRLGYTPDAVYAYIRAASRFTIVDPTRSPNTGLLYLGTDRHSSLGTR